MFELIVPYLTKENLLANQMHDKNVKNISCGAKKLHSFMFPRTLSNFALV